MPRLVGFGWFAALLEEQISEEIGRRILSCDQRRWSGRALGPGSMSSLTVTQISRSFGRSTARCSASAANSRSAAKTMWWLALPAVAAVSHRRHSWGMPTRRPAETTPDLFSALPTVTAAGPSAVPKGKAGPDSLASQQRHFLPEDLAGALKRLDDVEIDALLAAVTAEAERRGRRPPEPGEREASELMQSRSDAKRPPRIARVY